MTRKSSAYTISVIGILAALIILQAYVPMIGYIRILPGLPAISTIHLTVIIAGVLLGVKGGAGLGFLWGCISLIKAYTDAADPVTILLFRNPVIAIVPRVMTGIVAALVFNYLFKQVKKGWALDLKLAAAGVLGALTNTALVILFTWVFYAGSAGQVVHGATAGNLVWLLMGAFAVNALAEMIMAGFVIPILGRVLLRFKR